MLIKAPVTKLLRDRIGRSEIHHIQRPQGDHLGHAAQACRRQAVAAGAQNAADLFIRQLGGGDVEHTTNQPVGDEGFHRHAPGAGSMKNQHFVAILFHQGAGSLHAGRGDAEHGCGDDRLVFSHS